MGFQIQLETNPVIAAIKDNEGLRQCCNNDNIKIVFVLYGDICTIEGIVRQLKEADKSVMVHIDLISGLSAKEVSVDYIKKHTLADGIISTRPTIIKRAKEIALYTVLRVFILDSMAFENLSKQCSNAKPDSVEILPGLMPKIIKKIAGSIDVPLIVGGLISDKEDVVEALNANATSVSSSNVKVWNY